MRNHSKLRFQAEIGVAVLCAAVFVLTLAVPHWFEVLFDEAPDGGDGSLETWMALACSLVVGAIAARMAHLDWRRTDGFRTGA